MPWDATRLHVAAFEPDGTLGRVDPRRRRPGGVDRPARMVARRHPPPDQRPERLVEPVPAGRRAAPRAAGADGRRVRRSVLGLRPVVVRVPGRWRDRRDGPLRPGATSSVQARARGFIGEVETPFTELEALRVSDSSTIVALAGDPGDPTDRRPVRPGDPGASRGAASGEHVDGRPGCHLGARVDHLPDDRRPDSPTRCTTRRPTRTSSGPDGEKPPLVVLTHGGPTANASTGLDLCKQLMTSRGFAIVDVDYGGSSGYGRAYRRRLDGSGASWTSTIPSPRPGSWSIAATWIPSG